MKSVQKLQLDEVSGATFGKYSWYSHHKYRPYQYPYGQYGYTQPPITPPAIIIDGNQHRIDVHQT